MHLTVPVPHHNETIQVQQKLARVQSLLEAARSLHATIEVEEVLSCVLELAAKELEADGSFLAFSTLQFKDIDPVFGSMPQDWKSWTEDVPIAGYSAAPLIGERGEKVAHLVIYRSKPLLLEEQDFLEGLALQAALALKNARHHERAIEWERLHRDLNAAREIQHSLLPRSAPEISGYSLNFRFTPCYEVGGDYIDILPLNDGTVLMVLADVAGKGLASALISAAFRSSLRAITSADLPLEEMAARLSALHWLEGEEARRRYVTAIFVRLDPATHTAQAVNAGHSPAFLTGRGTATKIAASGPPLGMLPNSRYERVEFPLSIGAQLLLYTDGLTDVFRGDEDFGEHRLLELMNVRPDADFLDHVWTALERFRQNTPQTDDMTAVYLFRTEEGGQA